MPDLPSGTVTFLFTDVEGSTRLLHELGAEAYASALAEHRRLIRDACAAHGGVEVDTQGDAFFFAFPTAPGALEAAAEMTEALAAGPIQVRVGLHTGTPLLAEEGYIGGDVHRVARIAAGGHGGQILASASTAALIGPGEARSLRDLGDHRFRDLAAPERVYQLGDGEFPPIRSLYKTNLPVPASTFLGRERELAEVVELLARDDVRLLTLTGPGGTGKTRLGLQAAAESSDRYPDGVWWVPLAPLRAPSAVPAQIAHAVGATDELGAYVADKRMLLLLDNFEHLLDAAPPIAELLAACPNLEVLATSRELLQLQGELVYAVPTLTDDDGTELFLTRARAVADDVSGDATVGELCRRLDNLPLALELAAARTRHLTPGQLLERLAQRLDLLQAGRDADPRQQTLRATIDWSYELLDHAERELFARLSVFAGGFTLESAEAVCDADLDTLSSLVDKSLVRRSGARFWMLETIRELAAERLAESGDAPDRVHAHADYFLGLVERSVADLHRFTNEADWARWASEERGNALVALQLFRTLGEAGNALRMAVGIGHFHAIAGAHERRTMLTTALDEGESAPAPLRARACLQLGTIAEEQGDTRSAEAMAERALQLFAALDDPAGVGSALLDLGGIASLDGDYERAASLCEKAASLFEAAENPFGVAMALGFRSEIALRRHVYVEALRLVQDAVGILERAGIPVQTLLYLNAAAALLGIGDTARAKDFLRPALDRALMVGRPGAIVTALILLASALGGESRTERAAELLGAAERLREDEDLHLGGVEQEHYDALVADLSEALGERLSELRALGSRMTPSEAVGLALASID